MKRPPISGTQLRIAPNSGVTPEVSTDIVFVPYSTFRLFEYSAAIAFSPGVLRTAATSSSVIRILRPLPSPSKVIDVRPGQAITIRSPSAAVV